MPCRAYEDECRSSSGPCQECSVKQKKIQEQEQKLCDISAKYLALFNNVEIALKCANPTTHDTVKAVTEISDIIISSKAKIYNDQLNHRKEDAKFDLANLNKIKDRINANITKIKKLGGEPKKELWDDLKEVGALIDAVKTVDEKTLVSDRNYGLGDRFEKFLKAHGGKK